MPCSCWTECNDAGLCSKTVMLASSQLLLRLRIKSAGKVALVRSEARLPASRCLRGNGRSCCGRRFARRLCRRFCCLGRSRLLHRLLTSLKAVMHTLEHSYSLHSTFSPHSTALRCKKPHLACACSDLLPAMPSAWPCH